MAAQTVAVTSLRGVDFRLGHSGQWSDHAALSSRGMTGHVLVGDGGLVSKAIERPEVVGVRQGVAWNLSIPDEVLRVLAGDVDRDVRSRVHANPSASQETKAVAALFGVD